LATITITPVTVGSCSVVHNDSGAQFSTDLPRVYGGCGNSFSATDLLAAALGVCVATNLDSIMDCHGIPLSALKVTVHKSLSVDPKRVSALAVTIEIGAEIEPAILVRLTRAVEHCAIQRSLHPDIEISITFNTDAV
jgi:putative redox protein